MDRIEILDYVEPIDGEELITVEWFSLEHNVFACLSHMIKDGWRPSQLHHGVVANSIVARPMKYPGEDRYTGIALFNLNLNGEP